MKSLDKISEGAGITFNFAAGSISTAIGFLSTLLFLVFWAIFGLQAPLVAGYLLFGLTPLGIGAALLKRGWTRKVAFKRKLLRDSVRKLAFQSEGRVRPLDLVNALSYTSKEALQVLRELAAEDPENIDLKFDYDTGEIYFEFQDVIKSLAEGKPYEESLFAPQTLVKAAGKAARKIDEVLNLFDTYKAYKNQLLTEGSLNGRLEEYKSKVKQLQEEIERIQRDR